MIELHNDADKYVFLDEINFYFTSKPENKF
jgi:hypothetical protein